MAVLVGGGKRHRRAVDGGEGQFPAELFGDGAPCVVGIHSNGLALDGRAGLEHAGNADLVKDDCLGLQRRPAALVLGVLWCDTADR